MEEVYCKLNMEDNSDADYIYAKRVYKDFKIKNLGGNHNLFLKSDTLHIADVSKTPEKCV